MKSGRYEVAEMSLTWEEEKTGQQTSLHTVLSVPSPSPSPNSTLIFI